MCLCLPTRSTQSSKFLQSVCFLSSLAEAISENKQIISADRLPGALSPLLPAPSTFSGLPCAASIKGHLRRQGCRPYSFASLLCQNIQTLAKAFSITSKPSSFPFLLLLATVFLLYFKPFLTSVSSPSFPQHLHPAPTW